MEELRKMFGQMGAAAGEQVFISFHLLSVKMFPKYKQYRSLQNPCLEVATVHIENTMFADDNHLLNQRSCNDKILSRLARRRPLKKLQRLSRTLQGELQSRSLFYTTQ